MTQPEQGLFKSIRSSNLAVRRVINHAKHGLELKNTKAATAMIFTPFTNQNRLKKLQVTTQTMPPVRDTARKLT